jgi:hypothetical protein
LQQLQRGISANDFESKSWPKVAPTGRKLARYGTAFSHYLDEMIQTFGKNGFINENLYFWSL